MYCKNHPTIDADCVCSACGTPLCQHCRVALGASVFCPECAQIKVKEHAFKGGEIRSRRKSRFLTFLLSCIPGGGYMYLGLLNKGVILMSIYFSTLFAAIILSDIAGFNWLSGFFIPVSTIVFVFYSIFDSFALINEINSGTAVSDVSTEAVIEIWLKVKSWIILRKNLVGVVFVLIGITGVINFFGRAISDFLQQFFHYGFYYSPSQLLTPVLMIGIGLYLIKWSRKDAA